MGISNETISYVETKFAGIYSTLVVALLIFLIGFIIGKLLGKLTNRMLSEIKLDSIFRKATGLEVNISHISSLFITYLIYFITIIMVLNQLGVTTTVLQIILVAVVALIIISVVLAIKDFVPNAFAGLYIYRRNLLRVGESVKIRGIKGKVVHINLLETKLETKEGDSVYVPNSAITKTEIVKMKRKKV